jgi:TatD DNase family protein
MIDTHSHLFVEEFSEDLPSVIQRAKDVGVERVFMPNIDDESLEDMLQVCSLYPGYCFPMLGYHPTSVDASSMAKVLRMKEHLVSGHPFIAIGEVGLDLYWDKTYLREQQLVLDEQIQWALEWNLPLVIHCREAFDELLEVMAPYKNTDLSGIFHSFTGTCEDVLRVLDYRNFMIGINGVVTFKKSTLPEVLQNVPLSRIVVETDSPYLAPAPFRGKRNESSYIIKVVEKLAEVYSLRVDEISQITSKNALKVFKRVG